MKLIPQTVTITGAQWAAIITDAEKVAAKVAALTELVEERSEALYELGELLPDRTSPGCDNCYALTMAARLPPARAVPRNGSSL